MSHYDYFQNRECEYFPCHTCGDPENFSCLFCYCPLYALGDRCGGSFTYTPEGVKDCSGCLKPHRRENYGKIMEKMTQVLALAKKMPEPPHFPLPECPAVPIRRAAAGDEAALARLACALWPEHDEREMEQELAQLLGAPDAACFLAGDVGFAQCQLRHDYVEGTGSTPVGYLEGIYVAQAHRGQGIASALLRACENWAAAMGCTEFASDCGLDNPDSRKFHEKLGFAEANRIVCYVKPL